MRVWQPISSGLLAAVSALLLCLCGTALAASRTHLFFLNGTTSQGEMIQLRSEGGELFIYSFDLRCGRPGATFHQNGRITFRDGIPTWPSGRPLATTGSK